MPIQYIQGVYPTLVVSAMETMFYCSRNNNGIDNNYTCFIRAQSVNVTSSHVTVASSHVIYDKGCVQDTWIKIADLLIKQVHTLADN